MKNITALTLLLILSTALFANMASPIREGARLCSALSSKDIDISRERIFIEIDPDFKTATYRVEYSISTAVAGVQIPLLFHAMDYSGNFKVWVDGQSTNLVDIDHDTDTPTSELYTNFSAYFSQLDYGKEQETVEIYWDPMYGDRYYLSDLKYFETDLTKGEHTIRVEYEAEAWTDLSNWVKTYTFKYSLSPAKYWKSFGSIEIALKTAHMDATVYTNMGEPTSQTDNTTTWKFKELPTPDYLEIYYTPAISSLAKTLIRLSPWGLASIISLILIVLHIMGIRWYRKKEPMRKYSWVVIAGSILVPLLMLVSLPLLYNIIDSVIGEHASQYHGYIVLIVGLYPLVCPVYWLLAWGVDRTARN